MNRSCNNYKKLVDTWIHENKEVSRINWYTGYNQGDIIESTSYRTFVPEKKQGTYIVEKFGRKFPNKKKEITCSGDTVKFRINFILNNGREFTIILPEVPRNLLARDVFLADMDTTSSTGNYNLYNALIQLSGQTQIIRQRENMIAAADYLRSIDSLNTTSGFSPTGSSIEFTTPGTESFVSFNNLNELQGFARTKRVNKKKVDIPADDIFNNLTIGELYQIITNPRNRNRVGNTQGENGVVNIRVRSSELNCNKTSNKTIPMKQLKKDISEKDRIAFENFIKKLQENNTESNPNLLLLVLGVSTQTYAAGLVRVLHEFVGSHNRAQINSTTYNEGELPYYAQFNQIVIQNSVRRVFFNRRTGFRTSMPDQILVTQEFTPTGTLPGNSIIRSLITTVINPYTVQIDHYEFAITFNDGNGRECTRSWVTKPEDQKKEREDLLSIHSDQVISDAQRTLLNAMQLTGGTNLFNGLVDLIELVYPEQDPVRSQNTRIGSRPLLDWEESLGTPGYKKDELDSHVGFVPHESRRAVTLRNLSSFFNIIDTSPASSSTTMGGIFARLSPIFLAALLNIQQSKK